MLISTGFFLLSDFFLTVRTCKEIVSKNWFSTIRDKHILVFRIRVRNTSILQETSIAKENKETTSPWSFLLKELFEFTLSAPQFFIGGILLLSELLPIPLPVYTAEELNSPELVASLKRARDEWSEQLSPFTNECKALFRATAANCSPESHPYLWKCACQIGDLSAPLAIAITNQLKELLCSQLEEDSLRKEPDKRFIINTKNVKPHFSNVLMINSRLSGRSVHLLGTLAVITQQASLKSAYLKCIKENLDALKILCDLITREPDICPHPGKLSTPYDSQLHLQSLHRPDGVYQ